MLQPACLEQQMRARQLLMCRAVVSDAHLVVLGVVPGAPGASTAVASLMAVALHISSSALGTHCLSGGELLVSKTMICHLHPNIAPC
jgi:hypothetical protein